MNNDIELVPLACAIASTTRGETYGISYSLDVKPEWVSSDVARLYKEWQKLPDDHRYRMDWITEKLCSEPIVQKCLNIADEKIIHPKDAVKQIREDWVSREKIRLLMEADRTADECKKHDLFIQLASLYNDNREDDLYVVDMRNPPEANENLLLRNGIGFLPRNEITSFKAKAKSCKTTASTILASACISKDGGLFGNVRPIERESPYYVLFVDTEQSQRSSYNLECRILRMAGYSIDQNYDFLKVINLRLVKTGNRLNYLLSFVRSRLYDLVILDGIKDLAKDINDNIEADMIVQEMTSICSTYNVALLAILHENPSKDNDKMRGHLGTELTNKSHNTFEIERKEDVFNVKDSCSREKPIETWAFHFVPDPERPGFDILEETEPSEGSQTESIIPNARPTTEEKQWNQVLKAFGEHTKHVIDIEQFKKDFFRLGCGSMATAQNRIKEFGAKGWLIVDGKKMHINSNKSNSNDEDESDYPF